MGAQDRSANHLVVRRNTAQYPRSDAIVGTGAADRRAGTAEGESTHERAHRSERFTMPAGNLCALLLARARDSLRNLRFDPFAIFRRQSLSEGVETIGDLLPKANASADGEAVSRGARRDGARCDAGKVGDVEIGRFAVDVELFDHDSLETSVALDRLRGEFDAATAWASNPTDEHGLNVPQVGVKTLGETVS
jgi:hypothetical protein